MRTKSYEQTEREERKADTMAAMRDYFDLYVRRPEQLLYVLDALQERAATLGDEWRDESDPTYEWWHAASEDLNILHGKANTNLKYEYDGAKWGPRTNHLKGDKRLQRKSNPGT